MHDLFNRLTVDLKTARELRGISCLALEGQVPPRQEICCSRMFGKRLHELPPIREAVATYAARACEKLRAQHSLCKKVRVSIRTGMFNPDEPKFGKGIICELPYPWHYSGCGRDGSYLPPPAQIRTCGTTA
ncbi:hypothetical protein AX279_00090 [Pseudomonas sp. J237]|nr:hypothetical protein AX279_00090 [Pseudomonas sp. J237]